MIYIIHKVSESLKITRITLKIIYSNAFLRSIIDLFFKKIYLSFLATYNDEKFKSSRLQKKQKNKR